MEGKVEENMENETKEQGIEGRRGGCFISKQSLWFMAGGALGAIAVIGMGRFSKKIKPAAVGVTREGFAFKEWLMANYEKVKEDIEDIVAEAKHAHQKDVEKTSKTTKTEEEILKKVEDKIEEILKNRFGKEGV